MRVLTSAGMSGSSAELVVLARHGVLSAAGTSGTAAGAPPDSVCAEAQPTKTETNSLISGDVYY